MLIAASSIIPATAASSGVSPIFSPGYVAVAGGRITEVGSGPPPARPDIELTSGFLVPGLVDLQVNGYFGVELGDADPVGWAEVVRRLPETGATAFLPTFITSPVDEMVTALRATAGFAPGLTGSNGKPAGSRVLGVHLEGPFIAESRRGAHNPAWIISPDRQTVGELLTAGAGLVRMVTLAPEIDGAIAAIRQLADAGVIASVGHSDATARQVAAAASAGARLVTHIFNAQRPLHHREPGVVGQALTDSRLSSGLIADLHHVAGAIAGLAFRAAPGRIFLVTDATASAGMAPGRYVLGGEPIDVTGADGTPPVRADGTLAGSALRMDMAIANMVAVGIALPDAVAAATRIPADLIGRPDIGRIEGAAAADLTWLNDELTTTATWVSGSQVYGSSLG
ncbi:MAG TPA: N-acetylglucosamine-6-phosphate deacetylase [Streptosporangiaceae bacterium]|nr:N-acetylglucosamine-6-phosphate deacetylase [Streptosporangiaceae bacterium]